MIFQGRPAGEVIHCSIWGPLPRHPECAMDAWTHRNPSGLISTLLHVSLTADEGGSTFRTVASPRENRRRRPHGIGQGQRFGPKAGRLMQIVERIDWIDACKFSGTTGR